MHVVVEMEYGRLLMVWEHRGGWVFIEFAEAAS
jgi:hypothetical protein